MKQERYDDLPCGECEAGVYDMVPFMAGIAMFEHCKTRKQALAAAPMCTEDSKHICFGARDFIVSSDFPICRPIAAAKAEEG